MKTIGMSTDGKDFIVSMSEGEYREFMRLERSITDAGYSPFDRYSTFQGADLAPVFRALGDLADAKNSISSLQSYINNLAEYFGKVSPITKE